MSRLHDSTPSTPVHSNPHANQEKGNASGKNLFNSFPWLKKFAQSRLFQVAFVVPNLLFLCIFLIAGIFGSPVGNRNMMTVFVWIVWWFLLITFMVPFFSRLWCIMCPFPFFGEWFQRRALVKVQKGTTGKLKNLMFGMNKRWPRSLSNIWIQNIGFLILGTGFIIIATRPFVSALVIGGLMLLATALALFFQRRVFCSYICPVSGFLGLYSMSSTIELRSVSSDVCVKCSTKGCAIGNENGWACPWFLNMATLDRNNSCGLCMECMKSCPNDNIGLFTRAPFSDSALKGYDEAWKSFIMIALAFIYAALLQGPWGYLRNWANISETGNWTGFMIFFSSVWSICLLLFPALWAGVMFISRKLTQAESISWKKYFVSYSYVLVPLGLMAWIAFSIPLVMVNGSYAISVLSDPLGRGWNLFGTAHFPWTPVYPEIAVYLQIALLLIGLSFSLRKGYDIAKTFYHDEQKIVISLIPVGALCFVLTVFFLKLFAA